MSTGPGVVSQVGSGISDVDFRLYEKNRSCDVALAAVHSINGTD